MSVPGTTDDPRQAEPVAPPGADPPPASVEQAVTAAAPRWPARLRASCFRLLRRPGFWVTVLLLVGLPAALAWAGRNQLRAWYHYRAARAESQRFHNPQAVRHLHVCLEVWPEDPDVLFLAARAARRARSYAEAEHLLEKYQKARGLDDACSLELLLLAAERRVDQVADQCWRRVEDGDPDAPLFLEALTRGYMRQFRLGEARMCLDRWLESQPDSAQALCLDGQFHLDYALAHSAAETSYQRAADVDPEHEEARLGLAVVLLQGKNFPKAAEHLEFIRGRQPDNLSVQVGLAECKDAAGQAEEAVRMVDAVLARQPEFVPALALRGRLALKYGQPVEAEEWLRQAVARDPSNHLARYNLVQALRQNGKDQEAEHQNQRLLQMEDDLKRFNEIVTHDLLQSPRDPALHCKLGELLLRGGYQDEGVRWLQSALRLDPQYAPARKALAEHYEKAKSQQQPPGAGKN